MYIPPPGFYFTTKQVLDGQYVGDPRDNENYLSALARQNEMQEAELERQRQQQDDPLQQEDPGVAGPGRARQQQEDPGVGQGAGPGRARRIDVSSRAEIWRKIGDTMAHRVYSAWQIANTQHSPSTRGDRWTMDGDDSNSAFNSKDIGESVFTDTEPWDLFHAINDWPGLLRIQGVCTRRQDMGMVGLAAHSIESNDPIWVRADGRSGGRAISAASITGAYARVPSVGNVLWHTRGAPESCYSAKEIAGGFFADTNYQPLEEYLRRRPHTPPPDEEQFRRDRMWAEAGAGGAAQGSTLAHVAAIVKSTDRLWRRRGEGQTEYSAEQIFKGRYRRSTKEWYTGSPSRLYSPAEIGNVAYLDTGGRKLRDFVGLTDRYGAFATGGSRGGSYNDDDDDNDDPSPNDLRFDFDSTTPWWYREISAEYVGRNANSAQEIFNGRGGHQLVGPSWNDNDYQWVKRAEDDEGEHKENTKGDRYSAAELGNAIFADTGGQTLSDFLQRGQAGRPHRTRRKRTKRRRPRSRGARGLHRRTRAHKNRRKPKTRKPRKHARKSKTHRRRKHKGRHGTKRR